MTFSWHIYLRIAHSIWHHPHMKTMVYICITTIAASAMTLTIIAAIMYGFEGHTYQQLQSIHPDITMHAPPGMSLDTQQIHTHITNEAFGVSAMSPYATQYAMLYHDQSHAFHAVTCYAIDPHAEASTTALPNMIHHQIAPTFVDTLQNPGIVIGISLARYLHVRTGDILYLGYQYATNEEAEPEFDYRSVTVLGTYETGIEEQDMYVTYMSHELYEDIWDQCDIEHIGIAITDDYDDTTVATKLQQIFPELHVRTWKDAYPAILSALALEKYAMIAVFSLLLILASISSIALLYMLVNVKSREFAILIAMGMPRTRIQLYFAIISFLGACCASFCGIIIGSFVGWTIDTYHLIPLPSVYFVKHLPAYISIWLIGGICILTACINAIAAWIPSRSLYQIDIARTLKEQA